MREYLQIAGKLRKNVINLLCFELMYRAAVAVFIIQGARLAFNYSLKRMGYSYLTAENYAVFIKNPLTMGIIFLCAAVILLLLFFELCVIVNSCLCGYEGQSRRIRRLCFDGMRICWEQLQGAPAFCIVVSAMTSIFACSHFMIREIMEIKVLKYAAEQIYKWGNDKYFLILLLAFFVAVSICSMFTIPVLLCEEQKGFKAVQRSMEIFGAHKWETVRMLIFCNIAVAAGILAVYYLLMLGAAVLVSLLKDAHFAMATLFSLSDMVSMIVGFLSGLVGIILNMYMISVLYLKFERPQLNEEGLAEERRRLPLTGSFSAQQRKGVFLFLVIVLVEGTYLYSVMVNGTQIVRDMYAGTLVTAHRGGANNAPENTLAALESAIGNMSDYAEIDVQETADGALILMHDSSLKRTTGLNKKVWEVSLEEVKALDAGSSFSGDFTGEPVPTLQEVLELCKGRLDLNVEVKSNGHNEGIAQKTAALITEMGMQEQCVISSMNYGFLKQVKEENPEIRTGYIMSVAYGKVEQLEYADFLSVHSDCVTDRFVEQVHEAGKEVHVWTVNSRRIMRQMKALGVDNIITDRPGVVREILMEDKSDAGFLELLRFVLE